MDLRIALEGFFFEKVNRSMGQRVTFTFHYIIYAPGSRHTAAKGAFCFAATASKSLIRAKGAFCCTASRRVIFPSTYNKKGQQKQNILLGDKIFPSSHLYFSLLDGLYDMYEVLRRFLTLKVLVTTIDAQWEGMGDVGSARYEPALLSPCPTIRVLRYSS